jgi:hypothetical protein
MKKRTTPRKEIQYSLQRKVSGRWVDEGVYPETLEEAKEELKFYSDFYTDEKFRIEESEVIVLWDYDEED